jgi:hypothetical protein
VLVYHEKNSASNNDTNKLYQDCPTKLRNKLVSQ